MLLELRHHFARPQPPAVGKQLLHQAGGGIQQRHVVLDDRRDAGAQHLYRDGGAVTCSTGKMHLRHRGGGDRRGVEFGEHLGQRLPVGRLQRGDRLDRGKRRHLVLQLGQLVGDVERHQVATGGEHLAELDEDRPQCLQRRRRRTPRGSLSGRQNSVVRTSQRTGRTRSWPRKNSSRPKRRPIVRMRARRSSFMRRRIPGA